MRNQRFAFTMRKVFLGPNGVRAGWRVLIFFGIGTAINFATSAGLEHFPPTARILSAHVRGLMTVPFSVVIYIPVILAAFGSAFIMSNIERRPFGQYGLPFASAFGTLFWQGVAWGLVMGAVVMAAMYTLGGFSFGTLALSGSAAIKYAVLWAFAFLLVGLAEEFEYRGYAQFTLATGMGFWPSALLMSIFFGANHLDNLGESWVGALQVVVVGLFWCFTLRRTGTLWFAVGMHVAWNFAQSFLFSVSDSGLRSAGALLNSAVHGSRWLTGGAVGPEGSVFSFGFLGLSFIVFDRLYPARKASAEGLLATSPEAAPPQVS